MRPEVHGDAKRSVAPHALGRLALGRAPLAAVRVGRVARERVVPRAQRLVRGAREERLEGRRARLRAAAARAPRSERRERHGRHRAARLRGRRLREREHARRARVARERGDARERRVDERPRGEDGVREHEGVGVAVDGDGAVLAAAEQEQRRVVRVRQFLRAVRERSTGQRGVARTATGAAIGSRAPLCPPPSGGRVKASEAAARASGSHHVAVEEEVRPADEAKPEKVRRADLPHAAHDVAADAVGLQAHLGPDRVLHRRLAIRPR